MNVSFYSAVTGVSQQQERLDVHGNNIANVNTYGYRARVPSFTALITGQVEGIEEDLARGVGSRLEADETNFAQTGLAETGLAMDFAIEGGGFFALVNPGTGTITYTRDGSFTASSVRAPAVDEDGSPVTDEYGNQKIDTTWYLSDGLGRFVLSRAGTLIELKGGSATLGEDYPIGVFDFINRNGMTSVGDNRFAPVEKNGQVYLTDAKVVQGYLERSNVDLANELAKVIESQRSFSYMLKMVQTFDEIETTVNNLR